MAELAANVARIAAGERAEDSVTIHAEEEAARDTRSRFTVTARRRVRHWTDGAVIGAELFVREIAAKLFGSNRAEHKRLAKGTPSPDPLSLDRLPELPPGAPGPQGDGTPRQGKRFLPGNASRGGGPPPLQDELPQPQSGKEAWTTYEEHACI